MSYQVTDWSLIGISLYILGQKRMKYGSKYMALHQNLNVKVAFDLVTYFLCLFNLPRPERIHILFRGESV